MPAVKPKKIKRTWTLADKKYLRERWGKIHAIQIAARLGRTTRSVERKASDMGLGHSRTILSDVIGDFRKAHTDGKSDRDMARMFFVCPDTIRRWRERLELKRNFDPRSMCTAARLISARKHRKVRDNLHPQRALHTGPEETMYYYGEEETELIRAVLCFRQQHRRIPTLLEGFNLARELGWRKESNND